MDRGWTDHGSSIAKGVWAEGGKTQNYQIYSTVFIYDGTYTVPGGQFWLRHRPQDPGHRHQEH